MQTIILTREHIGIPWGFRLKGGIEYNVPLSILKVNDNSPAYQKLECGDTLLNIGNFSAHDLRHEEALNLIRMFDLTLPLIVRREFNVSHIPSNVPVSLAKIAPKTASSGIWRPPSLSSSQPDYSQNYSSPQNNYYQNSSNFSYNKQQQQQSSYNYSQPEQHYYNQSFPHYQEPAHSAAPPPPPPPPPAPPLPPGGNFTGSYIHNKPASTNITSLETSSSAPATSSGHVPDALAKIMNTSSGGRKPFSYTPGGLDLSHIRKSARVKKYDEEAEQQLKQAYQQNTAPTPYSNQGFNYNQPAVNYSKSQPAPVPTWSQPQETQYSPKPFNTNTLPTVNKKPQNTGFNITVDDLQKAKAPKEDRTPSIDLDEDSSNRMNQSFSFRMLNKWIEQSETDDQNLMVSKKDEEEAAKTPKKFHTSAVLKALEEEEKAKSKRGENKPVQEEPQQENVQPQYHPPSFYHPKKPQQTQFNAKQSSTNTVPSKVFQMLERKYSVESDNASDSSLRRSRNNINEEDVGSMARVPARERVQEGDIPKYKGAAIPSRSFRYLQYLTQDEENGTAAPTTATPTKNIIKNNTQTNSNEHLNSTFNNNNNSNNNNINNLNQNEQTNNTSEFNNGARRLIKNFENHRHQSTSSQNRYETRSESFLRQFEPKTETIENRYETRSEACSEKFEPTTESVVKTFESTSQTIVTTNTVNNENTNSLPITNNAEPVKRVNYNNSLTNSNNNDVNKTNYNYYQQKYLNQTTNNNNNNRKTTRSYSITDSFQRKDTYSVIPSKAFRYLERLMSVAAEKSAAVEVENNIEPVVVVENNNVKIASESTNEQDKQNGENEIIESATNSDNNLNSELIEKSISIEVVTTTTENVVDPHEADETNQDSSTNITDDKETQNNNIDDNNNNNAVDISEF